ncbi:MAG TPA: ABC transporter ATP-binding protein [Thermotogota bacterium]|nr:ABC transporter ATP-binding protein [Thermotogota bacterium]HPJ89742.1 ABC transporter ATP-binding protein [Thermotogota bacterium]HPR95994.1 ABC transporter ATP-binding protein [Thermotogota bacterium]
MDKKDILTAESVHYRIGEVSIIKDCSLKLDEGLFYGIIGPNGSGKTTLLDLLCDYRKYHTGEICLYGKPLNSYSKRDIARHIALVPQSFDIPFPFTVSDVIKMGRHPYIKRFSSFSKSDKALVDEVVGELELGDFLDRDFTTLSGGERQRVIFARALVQNTDIIFLDEATSNLDPFYCHSLLITINKWVREKKKTVLSVFHELNLASLYCDELFMMKDGKVKRAGRTGQIMTEENMKDIFRIESEIIQDSHKGKPFVMTRGII